VSKAEISGNQSNQLLKKSIAGMSDMLALLDNARQTLHDAQQHAGMSADDDIEASDAALRSAEQCAKTLALVESHLAGYRKIVLDCRKQATKCRAVTIKLRSRIAELKAELKALTG
jgi:hypothetical protein